MKPALVKLSTPLFAAALLAMPAVASAAFVSYTDQAAFFAASGTPTATEGFQGFTVDTPFQDTSVAFNGFSAIALGAATLPAGYNRVDTAPLSVSFVNGTTYFQGQVRSGTATTIIDLTFALPVMAFGADFAGADGSAQLLIDVFGPSDVLLGTLNPITNNGFSGFVLTDQDQAVRLRFRAGFSGVEDFGMDNVALVAARHAVPEPSALALAGLALAGLGLARRRRA
jgi:PEP-CTERM motif